MLYLSEEDVARLLTMGDALREVEAALRDLGEGKADNRPRQRVRGAHTVLNVMPASWPGRGYYGFKYYSISREGARFWFHLLDAHSGALLAVLQANRLGQQRTGAASGIATKTLAPRDATVVGILGTGWQAESQLEATCAVRKIARIRCHSRRQAQREAFAIKMSKSLGVDVVPVDSAEGAVRGADIVIAATTASEPVVKGEWLAPGAHVNAMGANRVEARELDDGVVTRASLIAADSVEQARMEAGDLIIPISKGILSWDRVTELSHVVAGKVPGRRKDDDITIFKSLGLAIEDVAVGAFVYERARTERIGNDVSV
ncbi:MAG TPA: ornithine cyclodeaminase family protein [Thermoplasmata archaeon]|nr:ornithine cyclodeaminase family protein [Thermoplasmata archaeon]